jgi:LmbE family N-acetylglucosaminyl deacetylase
MSAPITILGVFAHPDDEGSAGGVLARYAAAGARVYVACATRGDGADAKIMDAAAATRETLGAVRSQELACALERLGLEPPLFLGYQDGAVDEVPLEAAAHRVARLIRELRPAVIITHDPGGAYGHPDHIAVCAFTTRAFDLAGDPAAEVEGPPFAPAKLYYTAIPRSFLERVPAFQNRRADIRGQVLTFVGVPDEQITTEVDIREWLPLKVEALKCHRTQFEFDPETGRPKLFLTSLPEPEQLALFGHERFIRARSNVALALNGRETDLLAGVV